MGPENTNVSALNYPKLRIGMVYMLCAALSTNGLFLALVLFLQFLRYNISPYVGVLLFMSFVILCIASPVFTYKTKCYVQSMDNLLGSWIETHVRWQFKMCISFVVACAIAFIFIYAVGGIDRVLAKLAIFIMIVFFIWFDFKLVAGYLKMAKGVPMKAPGGKLISNLMRQNH
jgi:hypothetical protein